MTQQTNTTNRPVEQLRDGALKAAIFRNEGEKGPFFSVRFTRTYTDGNGTFHDSTSFSGTELLKLAHLAGQAYDRANALRAAETAKQAA